MELYVHIPFCRKKCRYCAFISYIGQEAFYETYIDLILKEAKNRIEEVDEAIRTIYIGGGTPSLLPPSLFRKLTDGLSGIFGFSEVTEFTVEVNPGTLNSEWVDTAVQQHVNRLSLGMQACQDSLLKILGRIHQFDDVIHAVGTARKAGISNINLDLIFGIPHQGIKEWKESIYAALSIKPEHISAYGLIPEEGTPLYEELMKGALSLPEPEDERQMYDDLIRILSQNDYQQYEISNFSKETYECRHNIGYWTQTPYIGLGVSAASMSSLNPVGTGVSYIRRKNPDSLNDYIHMVQENQRLFTAEKVGPQESRFETMMLGLRMNRGVDEEIFMRMHGKTMESCYGNKLFLFERNGLLIHDGNSWKMTRRGFDIQNSILVDLMD